MGQNTFTVKLNTGATTTTSAFIEDVEFVRGWWSSDAEGRIELKKNQLGEVVYFHVEVKGLAVDQKVILKLAEYDYNLFWDYFDPDDRKFPDKEKTHTETVQKVNEKYVVTTELTLDESWESMIKDDSDNSFSLDYTLELY